MWFQMKERHSRNRKNVKSADKIFRQQTLDRIAPRKYRLLRKGLGELYKIESIHTGLRSTAVRQNPALKGGTLQSLTPGILGPSSPAKLEKNQILLHGCLLEYY